jgi:hypothetical protein
MTVALGQAPRRETALVVAHPGHELRVHGWLERHHPRVFVLTDGSGSHRTSRTAETRRIVEAAGATPGSIFGRSSDRELYAALLGHDFAWFRRLADELAEALLSMRCATVVGDAAEGYNSGHDVCRLVVDAAVARVRELGHAIENLEFLLVGPPHACPPERRPALRCVGLDDGALGRKLGAALAYEELRDEVQRALDAHGPEPFVREFLWPSTGQPAGADDPTWEPYYEEYGRRQVAAGHYDRLVTYRGHVQPLADMLRVKRHKRAPDTHTCPT